MRDAALLQDKVIELNDAIISAQSSALDAQAEQLDLVTRVSEFEKEIARLKAWDAEKERYELTPVGDAEVFTYTLKEGVEPPEPSHQLCANCYSDGKKSILQKEVHSIGRAHVLVCHRCGSEIYTHGMREPEHSGSRKRR